MKIFFAILFIIIIQQVVGRPEKEAPAADGTSLTAKSNTDAENVQMVSDSKEQKDLEKALIKKPGYLDQAFGLVTGLKNKVSSPFTPLITAVHTNAPCFSKMFEGKFEWLHKFSKYLKSYLAVKTLEKFFPDEWLTSYALIDKEGRDCLIKEVGKVIDNYVSNTSNPSQNELYDEIKEVCEAHWNQIDLFFQAVMTSIKNESDGSRQIFANLFTDLNLEGKKGFTLANFNYQSAWLDSVEKYENLPNEISDQKSMENAFPKLGFWFNGSYGKSLTEVVRRIAEIDLKESPTPEEKSERVKLDKELKIIFVKIFFLAYNPFKNPNQSKANFRNFENEFKLDAEIINQYILQPLITGKPGHTEEN